MLSKVILHNTQVSKAHHIYYHYWISFAFYWKLSKGKTIIFFVDLSYCNWMHYDWIVLLFSSGKFTSFVVLCEKYEPCLKRDPSYSDYLEKIGQIFFNVKPNRNSNTPGFFGEYCFTLALTFSFWAELGVGVNSDKLGKANSVHGQFVRWSHNLPNSSTNKSWISIHFSCY